MKKKIKKIKQQAGCRGGRGGCKTIENDNKNIDKKDDHKIKITNVF